MITLKADNRVLTQNAKYSYLNSNYSSGVSAIVVTNSADFSANDYLLLGNFGSETAEIVQISTVTSATHTLNLSAATKFAHSESTRVTVIKYNQVRFYNTSTATFSATSPVTAYIDLQADKFFTLAYDTTNTTGFGWFVFYNATTAKATSNSNAIPYAGFTEYSVKKIFDRFFSQLNNKELKLVTNEDAFAWLNEGYSIARNQLNLVNEEYTVSDSYTLSVTSGTAEYSLPDYFTDMISVYSSTDDTEISPIDIKDVPDWNENSSNDTRYYLRGKYVGISPTPAADATYYLRYKTIGATLTSYYDNVELPDNNFYPLIDFMMYRAAPKLNRNDGNSRLTLFNDAIKNMKLTSHKRDNEKDSWDISPTANI